jgi:hypothetical protein
MFRYTRPEQLGAEDLEREFGESSASLFATPVELTRSSVYSWESVQPLYIVFFIIASDVICCNIKSLSAITMYLLKCQLECNFSLPHSDSCSVLTVA